MHINACLYILCYASYFSHLPLSISFFSFSLSLYGYKLCILWLIISVSYISRLQPIACFGCWNFMCSHCISPKTDILNDFWSTLILQDFDPKDVAAACVPAFNAPWTLMKKNIHQVKREESCWLCIYIFHCFPGSEFVFFGLFIAFIWEPKGYQLQMWEDLCFLTQHFARLSTNGGRIRFRLTCPNFIPVPNELGVLSFWNSIKKNSPLNFQLYL